jgi:hypothetical protein
VYRVVTVSYLKQGYGRRRVISRGPLHPDIERANNWAKYLTQTGNYHDVRVESGDHKQAKKSP